MKSELVKEVLTLKLKTMDLLIDTITPGANNPVRKAYHNLVEVVNEVTGDYIKESNLASGEDDDKVVRKIDIK